MNLDKIKTQVSRYIQQRSKCLSELKRQREKLIKLEEQKRDIEEAIKHVQIVAESIQNTAHKNISDVVTSFLQTVFSDRDYRFELQFGTQRNRTQAKPVLINNNHEIQNPLEEESGGVVDIASFACQLSSVLLSKPPIRSLLVLDEPFKYVSPKYKDAVEQILVMTSKNFKVQIIIITSHSSNVSIGKVVQL